ncbi:MAG: hypothetical protein KJI69_05185 [Patescibacteria group bacterium]|nr:hypothetical protein [Patescibacteria group bacterium]
MSNKGEKELDEKIKKENRSIVQIASRADKVALIKSDGDLTKAVEFLVQVKKKLKEYEEERLTYTKPINESLSKLNAKFKEITVPLKDAERGVKDGILAYKREREEIRLIEEKKLQKKNGNKNIVLTDAIPDIVESKSGEIRARKTWTFEVLEEKTVPRAYMMVDDKKVKEAIRNGERNIKGLKIFQEEDLSTY